MRSDFARAKYRPGAGLPEGATARRISRPPETFCTRKKFAKFHYKNYFPIDSRAVYKIAACSSAPYFVAEQIALRDWPANSFHVNLSLKEPTSYAHPHASRCHLCHPYIRNSYLPHSLRPLQMAPCLRRPGSTRTPVIASGGSADEPNSGGFYFNMNAYTPDGKQMIYTAPDGIHVMEMASAPSKLLVPNPPRPADAKGPMYPGMVHALVAGYRTNSVFYTKTDPATRRHLGVQGRHQYRCDPQAGGPAGKADDRERECGRDAGWREPTLKAMRPARNTDRTCRRHQPPRRGLTIA